MKDENINEKNVVHELYKRILSNGTSKHLYHLGLIFGGAEFVHKIINQKDQLIKDLKSINTPQ